MTDRIIKGGEFLVTEVTKDEVFTPEMLSEEQLQMAESIGDYITNEVFPDVDDIEKQNFDLVVKHMKALGELGLLMIDGPEEYGGMDMDKATSALMAETVAPSGSFSVAVTAHTGIGTLPLVYYGNKDQKERYLEKILTGEWLAAYCLTEPDSGSDALGAKATAVLSEDGKHYILNGTKQFITNAGFADLFTVFAKVDGDKFTAFLIEKDAEGLSLDAEEDKLGIKGSSTRPVILNNCKVPVENVLGEIGKGHKIAFNILNVGRYKLGAAVTGACKSALVETTKYANAREQFKTPIAKFGAIKEKIAEMVTNAYASEAVAYRIAGMMDKGIAKLEKGSENYYPEMLDVIEDYSIECAIAKVYCSELFAKTADEMVQTYGGYGFIKGYPAERYYRDERINRIFEGTNEVNRMIITGDILKRAMKGALPLQAAAMEAFEGLMNPSFDEIDEDELFAAEKALIANLKKVYLILSGAAVQKYMEQLAKEQEILLLAADVAMEIFAIESVVLRAEQAWESSDEKKQALMAAAVKAFTFDAVEKFITAAKKGAFYLEEGDNLQMILSGIRRYTKYAPADLLAGRRLLAETALEKEAYIF
jgi:alkylation response protein AidB-like acyl-CoA dehydrogenase